MNDILCLRYLPRIKINGDYFISNAGVSTEVTVTADDVNNILNNKKIEK